jgi:hypothetical protein
MSTVFDGLVRSHTITRAAAPGGTDAFGNPAPSVPEVTFRASLAATTRGSLVERYGADAQDAILIGESLEGALPASVTVGFSAPLTWAGRAGTLTVMEVLRDPLGDILDAITGEAFIAAFRAN